MESMDIIENNKTECMFSVLINTNLLRACLIHKIQKYFFAKCMCIYCIQTKKPLLFQS